MPFIDRDRAGKRLGAQLGDFALVDPVVLALPRGGVPVGSRVAQALEAPLDVIVVRKLGVPFQPELAMGAIGEDGVRVLDRAVIDACGVRESEIRTIEIRERAELEQRADRYRSGHPRIPLPGRTAVIVDDGMATGSTARAACLVARAHGAAEIVVGVPVASAHAITQLGDVTDQVVALEVPEPFYAVGQWYLRFDQTSDADVVELLDRARLREPSHPIPVTSSGPDHVADDRPDIPRARADPEQDPVDTEVEIAAEGAHLFGRLTVPANASGVVLFAHGSGSGRHSPRNRYVADVLNHAGFVTLLFDLLTPNEEHERSNVFDITLLGSRLRTVTDWAVRRPETQGLAIGYFGASTGAAAALWAAAHSHHPISAIVSRGGRPDLAGTSLAEVAAPTLLIVGKRDEEVLELNRRAHSALRSESQIVVVPRATHLFVEPGTLETVAALAERWFRDHLRIPAGADRRG